MSEILSEFGICTELDLTPLDEAGGVISWIKRAVSGTDNGVVDDLATAAAKVTTREEKETLLRELDRFLDEAETSERDGTFGDFLRAVGMSSVSGAVGAVAGATVGSIEASKMIAPVVKKAAWFEGGRKMTALRQSAATAAHKAAQFGTVVDKTLSGLTAAALAASMIVIVFRTVNRYSGGMRDYVEALRALRDQVRQIRVK